MIKLFLAWLKSIYFKPATADINMPEVVTMSEQLVDSQSANVAVADGVIIQGLNPNLTVTGLVSASILVADEVKAGVADFEAALRFVEGGVSQLGEAAKDELKSLAIKYL